MPQAQLSPCLSRLPGPVCLFLPAVLTDPTRPALPLPVSGSPEGSEARRRGSSALCAPRHGRLVVAERSHPVGSMPRRRPSPPRVIGLLPPRKERAGEAEAGPSCDYPHHTSPLGFFPFSKKELTAGGAGSFPDGVSGKESACQCRRCKRHGFDPWVGKISQRGTCQPTPVFLPGKSQGQRRLEDYSPGGRKESNTTEHTHLFKHPISKYSHILRYWGLGLQQMKIAGKAQ